MAHAQVSDLAVPAPKACHCALSVIMADIEYIRVQRVSNLSFFLEIFFLWNYFGCDFELAKLRRIYCPEKPTQEEKMAFLM